MKVGVLTYHRAKNYGAFLQGYGLCMRLNQEENIDAEIIDFRMKKDAKRYSLTRNPIRIAKTFKNYLFRKKMFSSFDRAYEKACFSSDSLLSDSTDDFESFVQDKYDVIVVGSDEVWKTNSFRGFPNPYWLPFKSDFKKVTYAAAIPDDFSKHDDMTKDKIKGFCDDFSFVTVRDEHAKKQLEGLNVTQKNIDIMPDPSFVYDYNANAENGKNILKKHFSIKDDEKIAVVMTESEAVAKKIKNDLGSEYRIIGVYEYWNMFECLADLSPFEWMDVIAVADVVIASYFHAICFSIINNKQFIAIGTAAKRYKLETLLNKHDLLERYIKDINSSNNLKEMIEELNNKEIYSTKDILDKERNVFDKFLCAINNLEGVRENG